MKNTMIVDRLAIRGMTPADIPFAAACTAFEGWGSETAAEFEDYLAFQPAGALLAQVDGQRVGICVATAYGRDGFVGELIVIPEWRGHGVGRMLLEHAIQLLHAHGVQSIYLDGVRAAVPLYERLGFRKVCQSLRFAGRLPAGSTAGVPIRRMRPTDLAQVLALDRSAFGTDRSFFLQQRLARYPELVWVVESDGELASFAFGRRGRERLALGPWLVRPGMAAAEHLLPAVAAELAGQAVSIGVLESNPRAARLLEQLQLEAHPAPPWRMVLGPNSGLGSSPQLYAIGSAAKG